MDMWSALEYGAWGLSVVLVGWMLIDARFVSTTYGEDFLLSSREGDE